MARELESAQGELEELRSSTAWRVALAYYRVRDGFPPFRAAHRLARKVKARLSRGALVLATPASLRRSGWRELCGLTLGKRGRVSVVLPVYNHASMLPESIQSVLSQTHRDLELIVVNDGSSDGVEAVLDRFADDPRVVVLTQPNQQLPSALNNGFAVATGEYFTWTSADNAMLPHQLEVLVRHLEARPEQAMVSDTRPSTRRSSPGRASGRRTDAAAGHIGTGRHARDLHQEGDNFMGRLPLSSRRGACRRPVRGGCVRGGRLGCWLRLRLFAIGYVGVLYRYRVHANTLQARARSSASRTA
jgi:glycosyltransferase involved in cell wall biosynthesis